MHPSKFLPFILLVFICCGFCQSGWQSETILGTRNFPEWNTTRGIAVLPNGDKCIAYGGDGLYMATCSGDQVDIETVDPEPHTGEIPVILADDDGNLHIFYDSHQDLSHAFRADGSSTWNIETISTTRFFYLSAVIDHSGNIHLAGIYASSYWSPAIAYLTDQSGAWTTEYLDDSEAMFCSISVTSMNEPIVCGANFGQLRIWFKQEGYWLAEDIEAISDDLISACIMIDSSDMPHIAVSYKPLYDQVSVLHFTGIDWQVDEVDICMRERPFNDFNLSAVIGTDDRIHLAYRDQDSIQLKYAVWDGGQWAVETVTNTVNVWYRSIGLAPSGDPVVAYYSYITDSIHLAEKATGTWNVQVVDTEQVCNYVFLYSRYYYPLDIASLAFDSSGNPHAAILRGGILYHGFISGDTWQLESMYDADEIPMAYEPDIFIDPNDSIHISFNSNTIPYYAVNSGSEWDVHEMVCWPSIMEIKSISVDNDGNPCFAGWDGLEDRLYFVWYTGGNWNQQLIDDGGRYASLACDTAGSARTGSAHISYMQEPGSSALLKYATGSGHSWIFETVDEIAGGYVGYHNSLALDISGIPHISYLGDGLSLASRTGGTWTIDQIFDGLIHSTSLAIDDLYRPHVAAENTYSYKDGGTWFTEQFDQQVCRYSSLALSPSQVPHVTCYDIRDDLIHVFKSTGAPSIVSISPPSIPQGHQEASTIITGQNLSNIEELNFGYGVRVNGFTIDSATQITADVSADHLAALGPRDVQVSGPEGRDVCEDCYEITFGDPVIDSINPPSYPQNETIEVAIWGTNFTGATYLDFGAGITVDSFEVVYNTEIHATITIALSAEIGPRNVTVTTPSGTVTCENCFEVEVYFYGFSTFAFSTIPPCVYTNTPFLVRVEAVDGLGRKLPHWNGTISLMDEITQTFSPASADIINGSVTLEATISETCLNNRIRAYMPGEYSYSNYFNVLDQAIDCEKEEVAVPVSINLTWDPNRAIAIAPDDSIWLACGYDNLWMIHKTENETTLYRADSSIGVGQHLSLAVDSAGNPHVSYLDRWTGHLKYTYLSPLGWQNEFIRTDIMVAFSSIAIDSMGNPHVCYSDGNDALYYSHRLNGEWVHSQVAAFWNGGEYCSIAIDHLDRPHMVFLTTNAGIRYYGYLDDVWQEASVGVGNGEHIAIAVDSNNNPFMTADAWDGSESTISYTYWQSPGWVYGSIPSSNDCTFSCMTMDDLDHIYVGCRRSIDYYTCALRYFKFDGSEWTFNEMDDLDENPGWDNSIALDSNHNPHMFYMNESEDYLEYANWNGTEWNHETVFPLATAYKADIDIDSQDQPVIVYINWNRMMNSYFNSDLMVSRMSGGTWQSEKIYENRLFECHTALDSNDTIHIIYQRFTTISDYSLHYVNNIGNVWNFEQIQASTNYFGGADFCVSNDGIPWVVYCPGNTVKVAHRTDSGWVFDSVTTGSPASIALGPTGEPRIVYCNGGIPYFASYSASGWSTEPIPDTEASQPKIIVDDNDVPHIVYAHNSSDLRGIYCATKSGSWIVEPITTGDSENYYSPEELTLDSADNPHLSYSFWHVGEEDTESFYAARIGGVWSNYFVETDGWTTCTQVALDSEDISHFSLIDTLTGDVWYRRCEMIIPPEIQYISPSSGLPQQSIENVLISGAGFKAVTLVDFGQGITIHQFNVLNNNEIVADISIELDAASGPRDVRVVAPGGQALCYGCFLVSQTGELPAIDQIIPASAYPGDSGVTVTVSGEHLTGIVNASFGNGITVDDIVSISPEMIQLSMTVSENAQPGIRDVSVTGSFGTGSCQSCFGVGYHTPPPETPATATPFVTPTPTGQFTRTPTPVPTTTRTATPSTSPTAANTATVTPMVSATATAIPSSTATPASSATPSSTPVTPSATSSPTPVTCEETGVDIWMPSHLFTAGDPCSCIAFVCNRESHDLTGYPLFVILDVYGSYFFAPSFSQTFDTYLDELPVIPQGETTIQVLPEFNWPAHTGTLGDVRWYGALTNPEITEIFGDWEMFTFGWDSP